jgi:hypothetical protein
MEYSFWKLYHIEKKLTEKLKSMQVEVLDEFIETIEFYDFKNAPNLHGLHGLIGSKNNTFVDSVRMQFSDPNDFIARWLKGMLDSHKDRTYINKASSPLRMFNM